MLARWKNISYLLTGTPRQQLAHGVLDRLGILEKLSQYNPVLVGTFPIGLDVAGSDLDIVCEVYDFAAFEADVAAQFGACQGFTNWRNVAPAWTVTAFQVEGFELEVFGQPLPTPQQNAYRHLVVEHRLLSAGDAAFRAKIVHHKQAGTKTEPAFACCLGLAGDPYQALLELESLTDAELQSRFFPPKSRESA